MSYGCRDGAPKYGLARPEMALIHGGIREAPLGEGKHGQARPDMALIHGGIGKASLGEGVSGQLGVANEYVS